MSGDPPGVLPESVWGPLFIRLALALAAGVVTFLVGMSLTGIYIDRSPWFVDHGNGGVLGLLAIGISLVSVFAVAGLWLPQQARSAVRLTVPAATVGAPWLLFADLWFVGGPSVESVTQSLDSGDLEAAEVDTLLEQENEDALTDLATEIESLDKPLAERAWSRALLARAPTCRQSASFSCAATALNDWSGEGDARRLHTGRSERRDPVSSGGKERHRC